jgi:hypothetical protein
VSLLMKRSLKRCDSSNPMMAPLDGTTPSGSEGVPQVLIACE